MNEIKELLKRLSEAHGISGYEDEVRERMYQTFGKGHRGSG